jgi:adenosine deaminase
MPAPSSPSSPSILDSRLLADCHLHFEGSLPVEEIARLAGRARHAFADPAAFERARAGLRDPESFLELYAEVCRLFRAPDDYVTAAIAVASALADGGLRYAEVYVSPEIFTRMGLDPRACLTAIDAGFQEALETRGILCRILLDVVRHWGPESADRVLDLHERTRLPSVVGFGMGGDEKAFPAIAFAGAYLRARALGLRTSVHAGEWAGADSVREVLDALRPDRLDHGVAAA